MRGFWADERVDGGLWNLLHPVYRLVYRFFKKKEREFLAESDAIVSLTHAARTEILSWDVAESVSERMSIIPCCVDLDHFDRARLGAQDSSEVRAELGLKPSDLVCCYLGSTGTWYLLEEMMIFFRCLSSVRPEAKFLFITPEAPAVVLAAAERAGVPAKSVVVRSAQREDIPRLLTAVNFGLFFIRPSYSKMSSSATKLGEFLAMGLPVVSNVGVGDQAAFFRANQVGALVNSFSVAEYDRVVADLPGILGFKPEEIRSAAQREFSLDLGVKSYQKIYEGLRA